MENEHNGLLNLIKEHARPSGEFDLPKYLGSQHINYQVATDIKRQIAKDWLKDHPSLKADQLWSLLDLLYHGESYDEKTLAGMLLARSNKLRVELSLNRLAEWLLELEGWAEVDGTCQSTFTADEVLNRWGEWRDFLVRLSESKDVSQQRASLVILVKPCRESDDPKLAALALQNVERLKGEKDILVTKAISWILREMTKRHRELVEEYLKKNVESLPAIAARETRRKLDTGKK